MKRRRLIAFALIAQLLAAPVTSGMLVLCFGSDGHVAVESVSANICCGEWETARRDAPDRGLATAVGPASGPCCNDLELSVESATLAFPFQKILPASALPGGVPAPAVSQPAASADPFPLPAESPVAASLRTVVLRA